LPIDLDFVDSPFSPVADPTTAACWSGHPQIRSAIERLHDSLLRRSDQSLDVMWANLGAGKTHTLYHLAYLFGQNVPEQRVIVAFVEMPEQIRGFLDLYRAIIRALPLRDVCHQVVKHRGGLGDVQKAANVYIHGDQREQDIAEEWIAAGRPHLAELRSCSGIGRRIEDDLLATDVLVALVSALAAGKVRLLLLFDEFQRVGVLGTTARMRMLSSFRTLFSRSPKYLSAVLAIQSMVESTALKLIPPELQTLIGKKPTIALPELNLKEAEEFVLGRFDYFRPQGFKGTRSAPFEADAIPAVLEFLQNGRGIKLIPREILLALAFVYDAVEESGSGISRGKALECLASYGN